MKKRFASLLTGVVILVAAHQCFASGEIYEVNQSADFNRMFSRNASTDVDAVFYNPAGTTALADGFYISYSDQIIRQSREADDTTPSPPLTTQLRDEYEGEALVYLCPDLFAVYKKNNYSLYGMVCPIGGTGSVDYKKGLPEFYWGAASRVGHPLVSGNPSTTATDMLSLHQEVKGTSAYLSGEVGAAYELNDVISFAFGVRYIYADSSYKGDVAATYSTEGAENISATQSLDATQSGNSFGTVTGLNINPTQNMNIGIRYEWFSTLDLDTDVKKDDFGMFSKSTTYDGTLPQVIGLGVGYKILPDLSTQISFDDILNNKLNKADQKNDYRNSTDEMIGFEYTVNPKVKVSTGYMHSTGAYNDAGNTEFYQSLNFNAVALGGVYTMKPGLDLCLGYNHVFFKDVDIHSANPSGDDVRLSRVNDEIGIGATYKFR